MTAAPHPPVFVVGCSRSGTTVCQSVLSQSPDLVGFPESNVLYLIAGDLNMRRFGTGRGRRFPAAHRLLNRFGIQVGMSRRIRGQMRRFLKAIDRPDLIETIPKSALRIDHVFQAFTRLMDTAGGGRRWLEKSPQNVFVLDLITRHLPDAQFVHIVRDERDNIASLRHAGLTHRSFKRRFGGPEGLAQAVEFWNRAALCSAQWRGHAGHVFLRYEDLCADPERTVRRLCEALRVSFVPDMLTYRPDGITKSREVWKQSSPELRQAPSKFPTVLSAAEQAYVIAHSLKADTLFPRQTGSEAR